MRSRRLALLMTAAVSCVPVPATAQAGCGGVHSSAPVHRAGTPLPPLAVGDSSMLLALPDLGRRGFAANAHGCRQFPEALQLLRDLRHDHRLPYLVVIALGADGSVTPGEINSALDIVGRQRRLVLVTPLELGGGEGADARLVRRADRLHPGRINVLDWVRYSRGHPGWFQPDGLHLTFSGAAAFARFLVRARPLAQRTPTAFGSLLFTKPGHDTRIAATLRLTSPPGWKLAISAQTARNAAPGFRVRRRGPCATRITLKSKGRRVSTAAGLTAHLATLVPPNAAILDSASAANAKILVWRTADGDIGGAWATALGDPFPDDGDRTERAYLDISASAQPLLSTQGGCAQSTLFGLLSHHLHRLAV